MPTRKPNDQLFSLEYQFELYLKRTGQSKENIGPIQMIEIRKAFMAGACQLLLLMRDEVSEFPEPVAVAICENMMKQFDDFWRREVERTKIMSELTDETEVKCSMCDWKGLVKDLNKPAQGGYCTCPKCQTPHLLYKKADVNAQ